MKNRVEAFKALIFVRSSYFINIIHCLCSENCPEDTDGTDVGPSHTSLLHVTPGSREASSALFGYLTAYMCGCSPLLLPPLPLASLPDGYIDSLHGNYTM